MRLPGVVGMPLRWKQLAGLMMVMDGAAGRSEPSSVPRSTISNFFQSSRLYLLVDGLGGFAGTGAGVTNSEVGYPRPGVVDRGKEGRPARSSYS